MANISELKFDDKNFNKHTERGMSLLEKSLRQNGAGRSILLDKDNNIIAGKTMKPVGLFGYLIENSTKKGDIVLDSFGGSGTTLIACEQLGRKCLVMELDPHYCDVIRKRYWKFKTGSEQGWQDGTKVEA